MPYCLQRAKEKYRSNDYILQFGIFRRNNKYAGSNRTKEILVSTKYIISYFRKWENNLLAAAVHIHVAIDTNEHFHLQSTHCSNVWTRAKGSKRITLKLIWAGNLEIYSIICKSYPWGSVPEKNKKSESGNIVENGLGWDSRSNL